jgi:hypothetical protein
LDMKLKANNIIKHTLDLCVKLLTKRVGAQLQLLVPSPN